METSVLKLFVVAALIMGVSHTIAKERICAGIRDRLGGRETFFGYLVSCPYCVSHWVAFAVVPLTGAYYVEVAPDWGIVSTFLQWFLSSVFMTVPAAFLRVVFYFFDETQGLVRRRQKVVERAIETPRS